MRWMTILTVVLFMVTSMGLAADESQTRVKLETSSGEIILVLDAKSAPHTVANFLTYVRSGHYNGTIFHRVIPGFMIQGGGMAADMREKPTLAPIRNEADNGLTHLPGTIAMARTMDPHSATAQFFINTVNNDFLNHKSKTTQGWGYCVFGKVVAGMDAVNAISKQPTTSKGPHRNVPVKAVVIRKATVVK